MINDDVVSIVYRKRSIGMRRSYAGSFDVFTDFDCG